MGVERWKHVWRGWSGCNEVYWGGNWRSGSRCGEGGVVMVPCVERWARMWRCGSGNSGAGIGDVVMGVERLEW